jgi:ABC-2 type transport system permease protein
VSALAIHFSFQFLSMLRSPAQMLLNYLFPLAFYAFMGLVMTEINPGFRDDILVSMTVFVVVSGALLGLPGTLVDEREAGIYRAYRVNGVPAAAVLAMPALTLGFHALIAASLVAVTAVPLFGAPVPASWGALVLCTVLGAALFAALGTLIGVVSPDSRATVLLAQAIFLPSMLLGGLMVPLDALPSGAQVASLLLPTTWLVQLEQATVYGREVVVDPALAAAVLVVSAALTFGIAAYSFSWDRRNATRRGHPALALLAILPFVVGMLVSQGLPG